MQLVLPLEAERVLVAVSGGADSTALLLALDELRRAGTLTPKLTVAHLNHGLRGESGEADARWVAELAQSLDCDIALGEADVAARARGAKDNLEQAARRARYEFLSEAAEGCGARAVLTAHTMDDQAETVLMRLMRGSGMEGLGGMKPVRPLDAENGILLFRPLLGWARRAATLEYCQVRGVAARHDAMNEDERFSRVRVRRQLLPLMHGFNGRIVEALSRTASLLRDDADALAAWAAELFSAATAEAPSGEPALRVDVVAAALPAVRRRVLRLWLAGAHGDTRRLALVHLVAVESLLRGGRGGRYVEVPGAGRVERRRGLIIFHAEKVEKGDSGV